MSEHVSNCHYDCPGCEACDDFGPPMDPSEREYYERMSSTVMPPGMKLDVRTGREGPREDPYGWTEYRVTMPDGTRTVYRDGILSESLLIVRPDGERLQFEAPEYQGEPAMDLMFKDIVGYGFDQLDWWANAEFERYADIREAELAAGWDPSP